MLSSLLSSPQTLETSKSKNIIKIYFKFMEQICSSVLGVEPGASHMTGKLSVPLSYTPGLIGVLRFILLQECFTCMYKCMLCLVPAGCWKRAGVNRQLWTVIWILETKPEFSQRAASALNPPSPTPVCGVLITILFFFTVSSFTILVYLFV